MQEHFDVSIALLLLLVNAIAFKPPSVGKIMHEHV
jgi:hypothetical protein